MTLWSDFLTNDQRLIHKWKHYFPAYERHLGKFVNTDVVFFENRIRAGRISANVEAVSWTARTDCGHRPEA